MTKSSSLFLSEVRRVIRLQHYSIHIEETYLRWIKRYILFHNKRHPKDMGGQEIVAFLSYLAEQYNVAPATKSLALNALLFLYRHVLNKELEDLSCLLKVKHKQKLPVVLTVTEVQSLLNHLHGAHWLMMYLMYTSGLRLTECVRLRVGQIDLDRKALLVINDKGGKNRIVKLSVNLVESLKYHLEIVKVIHEKDLQNGHGKVVLPCAVSRKCPNAGWEWCWQYLFPSARLREDMGSNTIRRHHVDKKRFLLRLRQVAKEVGIRKFASYDALRCASLTYVH